MQIVKIDLFQCNTPFKLWFASPHTTRTQADSVIVELCFNNGIVGYGESAPRSYVTGETCLTVTDLIKNLFSHLLLGRTINSVHDLESSLELLEKECIHRNRFPYLSALGAIDIALFDALGKLQKVPVHAILGPIMGNETPHSLSIPMLSSEKLQNLFHRLKSLDIQSVKIILGDVESDNIERVRLIRSLFGMNMDIRIEANGKWTQQQAISNIEKLKRFNISAVEQPVAAKDFDGLKNVRTMTGVPVVADESIMTFSHAKELVEMGACDIINIKISKCGGLLKSRMIADFAQSRNVRCQVGAHVGETEILRRAGEYFTLATPDLVCFEGFSSLLFDSSWAKYRNKIKTDYSSNVGLGIESNTSMLQSLYSLSV
jgi:muconate cycloisomerase